ncbi:MAG: hypothetical protein KAS67_06995 [Thermoplasmata archaeon]|nr:hypothetical protein [Thermoplasmata archaeon]
MNSENIQRVDRRKHINNKQLAAAIYRRVIVLMAYGMGTYSQRLFVYRMGETMEVDEFTNFLDEHREEYEWAQGEHEGNGGIFVRNKMYEAETHYTEKAIASHDLSTLIVYSRQGRNVENITRVTGFFSKVGSWNKGKTGELNDRHRDTDI